MAFHPNSLKFSILGFLNNAFFTVKILCSCHMLFNLSPSIYWLPKLGQGSDLVRKIVTQRMNLQEFSKVIYVFDSNI